MTQSKPETLLDVEQHDENWMPDKLSDAIEWLIKFLHQVPPRFRDSATIEIGSKSRYESTYATIEIKYWRPETELETGRREIDIAYLQSRQEAQERATLAALQAKYGTKRAAALSDLAALDGETM